MVIVTDLSSLGVMTNFSMVIFCESASRTETVLCDYLFSSMPLKDLVKGLPDVPEDISRIAGGLPYRDFVTVGLLVRRGENEISSVPDCWIYVQERDVKIGRLQLFNNWSPYMVADPKHTMWIGLEYFCNEGDELWSMSDEDFIDFAIGELVKIDVIDRSDVIDSTRIRVKKAYPAYFDTYSEFDTVKDYLSGIENLWCLGRNGQHRYNNMDHSMLTAMEAVRAIAAGSTDKSAVWGVNTEKEYHETKKG